MKLFIAILCMSTVCTIGLCGPTLDEDEEEALIDEEERLEDLLGQMEIDADKRQNTKHSENQGDATKETQEAKTSQISEVKPILPFLNPCRHKCCERGVAIADLNSGYTSPEPPEGIMIAVDSKSKGRKCSGSGKLKATFESITNKPCNICMSEPFYGRRMLKIVLTLAQGQGSRSRWLFGVSDSESADGYGGDANTNIYDAEIDGRYPNIIVYSNDACKGSVRNMATIYKALEMSTNTVTLYIANGFVRVVSGAIDQRICSECLFGLNGQKDINASGNDVTNYDIFMRFNGVVNGRRNRRGYGLCRVAASWVCVRDDNY